VQHQQYEKAVDLYIMAKRHNAAIEMCIINKVPIAEGLTDKLTPAGLGDFVEKKDVLKDLAIAQKVQVSFALA
jgi:hypothetical protein